MRHVQRSVSVVAAVVMIACASCATAIASDCPELSGRVPGPFSAVAVSGDTACLVSSPGLLVADVSDPTAPRLVGELAIPGRARAVAAADGVAYVAAAGGLRVVDVSVPAAPVEVAFVDLGGDAMDVVVDGSHAYVVTESSLHVVDVGTSSAPVVVGSVGTQVFNRAVAVAGGFAYLAGELNSRSGFWIYDVSTPAFPRMVGGVITGQVCADIAASDAHVYLAETWLLRVFDVTSPAAPTEVGTLDLSPGNHIASLEVLGSSVYLQGSYGLFRVVDVSTPSAPVEVGSVATAGSVALAVSEGRALAAGDRGLQVVDVSEPTAPVVTGSMHVVRAGKVAASGVFGYVTFGSAGWSSPGLAVVDLSTPSQPIEIGSATWGGEGSFVRAVAISGSHAYVLYGSCAWLCFVYLGVVDVSSPSMPWETGLVEIGSGVGLAVANGHAYVAAADDGLRVVDVSEPSAPREAGLVDTPGWALGVAVSGAYAYIADGQAGLTVVDVSTPSAPVEVGSVDTPGAATGVAVSGAYAYVADGEAGLRVIDVRSPSAPVEIGFVDTPGSATAVAVSGRYAYVAGGEAGLYVVDVSEPVVPVVVGSHPTGGAALGVAVADGSVLVASGDAGLFLLGECAAGSSPDPRESFIPAAALTGGAEGSSFRTDVDLNNRGAEPARLVVEWLPRGEDNPEPVQSEPIVLAPGQGLRIENVLPELFGLGPGSVGALRLVASTAHLIAMSRTYTTRDGTSAGTFGQGMPAVRATEMIAGTAPRRIVFLSEDSDFRANVGCVNGTAEPVRITIGIFDREGTQLAVRFLDLGPYSNAQVNRVLGDWAPVSGYVDVWADREDALYACYGSVLDNLTSDPTTVLPR